MKSETVKKTTKAVGFTAFIAAAAYFAFDGFQRLVDKLFAKAKVKGKEAKEEFDEFMKDDKKDPSSQNPT